MPSGQLFIHIALTSLLATLITSIIAALLKLRPRGVSLQEILLGQKMTTFIFFGLLIPTMPFAFALFQGSLLSSKGYAIYLKELLVSVTIVVSFSIAWKMLAYLEGALQSSRALDQQQTLSAHKWIKQGMDIGYYELLEEVRFGTGLRPAARLVLEQSKNHRRDINYQKRLGSLLHPKRR